MLPHTGSSARLPTLGSIRKVFRAAVAVVRLGKPVKPDSEDCRSAFEHHPGNAVHPVHDPVVGSEDDGDTPDRPPESPHVLHDIAHRWCLHGVEPAHRVDLAKFVEGDLLDGPSGGHGDETVNVSYVEPFPTTPDVVPLAHVALGTNAVRR